MTTGQILLSFSQGGFEKDCQKWDRKMKYNNRQNTCLQFLTSSILNRKISITLLFFSFFFISTNIFSADVITNGSFDTDITTGWTNSSSGAGISYWDDIIFGNASGSASGITDTNRNRQFTFELSQSVGNINSNDNVFLSFYWYKWSETVQASTNTMIIRIIKPAGDSTDIWTESTLPGANSSASGTITAQNVSSFFDQNGTYTIRLIGDIASGNDKNAFAKCNFDDVVLDVQAGANSIPAVISGATQVSITPVNRLGTNTTVISTVFSDADQPGIGAFNVTFKIREPNNTTELILVNNQPNGGGGLTITDNGGGSYTASYTYDPSDLQTIGLYDLYFEVSDGIDNVIDGYANNLDELEINEVVANNPPSVVFGATQVSISPVNRLGTNTTVISTDFTDTDQPGVGAFTVTFSIREPDNTTELILVNNQSNGSGGLTIFDNGGGSYTASYTYDPSDLQTIGLYDLYFYVSDGIDNTQDNYGNNLDELEINEVVANNPPSLTNGITSVSLSPVPRFDATTTTLTADFSDSDIPGIGAFTCTFKVRQPDNVSEDILVNNLANGAGGLTITDLGAGNYRAEYNWDPPVSQTLGLYDLYFEVSDGTDNAIDDYTNNLDELEVIDAPVNNPPTVTASATQVSVSPVNRYGTNNTVISTTFSDADQPGVGAFNITFKIREPDNLTEVILVNNLTNGSGGLTIVDNGAGSYTASYTYDPGASQTIGLYDLYFEVTDGVDNAIDDYVNNTDELEIIESIINNDPVITAGQTRVTTSPVNRYGNATTTIYCTFSDADIPGVAAFYVTFKIREPNNTTELILVNNEQDGLGGLTIIDMGSGVYRAEYTYNPLDAQTQGLYDLYCEVSDGITSAIDGYANNPDELEINEIITNIVPTMAVSATTAFPSSIDRFGAITTNISTTFSDNDAPGINTFFVTFHLRGPFNQFVLPLVDSSQNGINGVTITDNGGGSYTANYTWDPADNITLGYYDLYAIISDGQDSDTDYFDDNPNELLITNGGENAPPIVSADAAYANPFGVERVGANITQIGAQFLDADLPGINAFTITIKLREPDNSTELILANGATNGTQGVTITDEGSGVYRAVVNWDPPDVQQLGFYDIFFQVSDGVDTSTDGFSNNSDELQVYDPLANNPPTVTAGATQVSPSSVNRIGSEFTTISTDFSDPDMSGTGSFTITIRVRDASSVEYTLVNAAKHGEQGLRIKHISGPDYQASVLWNPPDAQTTGNYDLYFYVQDNNGGSATDGYVNNTDELAVTSSAILGDGRLLRRTHDANQCTSCHNMLDHQSQDCLVCHTPHSTTNIYMVRETIQTPNSGPRSVVFKTLGIGDPYNDPDPVVGDPNSGAMADSTNGVFTGVCEVCHTATTHHRNDGTEPPPNHHDAENCTSCHPHTDGFAVSGGGESSGGDGCSCHSSFATDMNSSTTTYHHQINSQNADYNTASKTCLMCHVHHDIFRPDLNTGFGQRSSNLRVDITTPVVQGSASVLANRDYSSTGTGGICLSCHTSGQTKSFTPPDGSTSTVPISKTDFDGSDAHNYTVTSTFSTDGSSFNANCIKCHNDNRTKSFQNSTNKFSTHVSNFGRLLDTLGQGSLSDPLEENLCFGCHSGSSGSDFYGSQIMTTTSQNIQNSFSYTYTHPTTTYSGRHSADETAAGLADGNRHAECIDCHNPHAAQKGTHDGSSNLVSNALKGAWGVEPTSWPAAPVPTDNANVFVAPSSYNVVNPAQYEYQICLKCHSNYTTLPTGARNLAEEINPNYPSTHGITIANQNPFCNTSTMLEPWASSGIAYCSDCHRSDVSTDPNGPHGSNQASLLVASITSDATVGTPLCYVCHSEAVYWSDRNLGANSRDGKHPSVQGAHKFPAGCFSCHMWDHASTPGLGVTNQNDWGVGAPIPLFVHGQNKKWVYNEQDGSPGSLDSVDAFNNGYIANIDYTAKQCWTETCKNHSPQSY